MTNALGRHFRVGHWAVLTDECRLCSSTVERHVRPLVMDLLVRLARNAGQVVRKEELLASIWEGRAVNESALSHAVAELREALDDTESEPRYVETIAKRGYRLIAAVQPGHVETRIAVLPFRSIDHGPGDDIFADGITDAVIVELGRLAGMQVISHQTTASLRDSGRSIPQIARELHVDVVVEGSVLHSEGRVRVTMMLFQPEPEHQLWADTYETEFRDVIALQDRVAHRIADAVRTTLASAETTRT